MSGGSKAVCKPYVPHPQAHDRGVKTHEVADSETRPKRIHGVAQQNPASAM